MMDKASGLTLLVLGDPSDPIFKKLDPIRREVNLKIAKTGDALRDGDGDAAKARVLLNWSSPKPEVRRAMEIAPKLEWIHTRAVGMDLSLFPGLVDSSVVLTNGKGVFSQSLAEFAMLGALYFAKDVPRMRKAQAERRWDVFNMLEVSRQTMGIVGYGDIGRATARRAKAFGMKVLALRRNAAASDGNEYADRVFAPDELMAMLPECDYVVVTAPLTVETKDLISEREFGAMKNGAVIMNVGRGPVINEQAMIEALASGHLKGAVLDVFEVEPLPYESPLWAMDNVLMSAHTADHTPDWHDDAMSLFLDQFSRWRKGEPLRNVVDKRAGY